MKRIAQLILLTIFLAACAAPAADIPAASPGPSAEATRTRGPSRTPGPTKTLIPSHTPGPSKTITPLSTIPIFAPTFDVRTIVTATPEPKAKCPKVVSAPNADLGFLDLSYEKTENRTNLETNLLKFLNQHGATALEIAIKSRWNKDSFIFQDLTNDSVSEVMIGAIPFYIFGCQNGQYVKLFEIESDAYLMHPSVESIRDANRNGLSELTVLLGFASQGGHSFGVYEWNGENFSSLIASDDPTYPDSGSVGVETSGEIHYEDINHDFVQELIVDSGIPIWETYYSGLPWRNERTYYAWDGKYYSPGRREFAKPDFRFQAVQDGDLATTQQEYPKALEFYQQVIFSDKLENYSPEVRGNLQQIWGSGMANEPLPTPTPVLPDPTEYPRLAAYAYYRMILLHTFLGETEAAQIKYATLQEKFPAGNPGQPYVEMATEFWNAYQSSGLMYDACAAAIAYADAHPEILTPLGSDYHGAQSHTYIPADVCPFR